MSRPPAPSRGPSLAFDEALTNDPPPAAILEFHPAVVASVNAEAAEKAARVEVARVEAVRVADAAAAAEAAEAAAVAAGTTVMAQRFQGAILHGTPNDLVHLIQEHPDFEQHATDPRYYQTPLMLACEHGRAAHAKVLLEANASPDFVPILPEHIPEHIAYYICPPMTMACLHGHPEIVLSLLQHRANVDIMDTHDEMTPLEQMCQGGLTQPNRLAPVQLLCAFGATRRPPQPMQQPLHQWLQRSSDWNQLHFLELALPQLPAHAYDHGVRPPTPACLLRPGERCRPKSGLGGQPDVSAHGGDGAAWRCHHA
eukprot:scaffold32598_cov69-Phaeocystis_antarctica.AAC.2